MRLREPAIDIVVVTHNSGDVIEHTLLATAINSLGLAVRTWVVDNASTDGTQDIVRRRCPWARLLEREDNLGFAAGCNVGARHGEAPLVLFLNPDCVLAPRALSEMVAYLRRHPEAAAVGPLQVGSGGAPIPSHQRFPSLMGELERTFLRLTSVLGRPRPRLEEPVPRRVDWISGACMLVRREALVSVGAFDEGFFLYYEETDWCRRAAALNFEVHHQPDVTVTHAGGTSVRRSSVGQGRRRASGIFRASRFRYFRKHHGLLAAAAVEMLHRARGVLDALKARIPAGGAA